MSVLRALFLALAAAVFASAAHGDPHIRYFHGYFELGAEQALSIEFVPPRCDYWNFQLNNHWMESLDFRHHRVDLNHHGAVREPDGSVRLVVAPRDPGHPNWLDTAGHARGTMCLRYVRLHADEPDRAGSQSLPRTRVTSLGDV